MALKTFAAIDVGSFELAMKIFEISPRAGLREIDDIRHRIDLGTDTYTTGKISNERINELCEVLKEFKEIMRTYKVNAYRAYATSALRETENRLIILDMIKNRTGLDIEVLSNSEQRFLDYKAIASKGEGFQKIIEKGTAIVDIGGGSVQISLFDNDSLITTQNIRLGVLRMRERILSMQVKPSQYEKLIEEIVDNQLEILKKMYFKDRVIECMNAKLLWAPGVTLCDGMVYEYAEGNRLISPEHDFEKDILACVANISKRYMGSKKRSESVENIALTIFDSMKKIHGLGKRERLLLQIAAKLYDCGKYISMTSVGECSYSIIMATEIIGLSHLEREMVANIVKYNRIDFPYYHENGEQLGMDLASYLKVAKLTAILKLSNGLDRSHKQKFKTIKATLHEQEQELVLSVDTAADITLEKGLIKPKAKFFEEVYSIRPVIRQKRNYGKQ